MPSFSAGKIRLAAAALFGLYLIAGLFTQVEFLRGFDARQVFMMDYAIYRTAVERTLAGTTPYVRIPSGFAHTFPPPSIPPLWLLTLPPAPVGEILFSLLNVAILVGMVFFVFRAYHAPSGQAWPWLAASLFFAPFLELITVGQINMVILLGILLAFFFADRRPVLAGLGLTLGIVMKITPLVLLGYLFFTRSYKAVLATSGALMVVSLLNGWLFGFDLYGQYFNVFRAMVGDFGGVLIKQGLTVKLMALSILPPASAPAFQQALTIYFGLLLLAGSLLYRYHGQKEPLFALYLLAMNFYPHYMWYHHYVFFLLPMLILLAWSRFRPGVVIWSAAALLLTQVDRYRLTSGLLIHLLAHLTVWALLVYQLRAALPALRLRFAPRQPVTAFSTKDQP